MIIISIKNLFWTETVPQQHWDIQITRADRVPPTHWDIQNIRTYTISLERWDIQMAWPNMEIPLHCDIQRAALIEEACVSQLDMSLGQLTHKQKRYLTLGYPDYRAPYTGAQST